MEKSILKKWTAPEYASNPFLILAWLTSGAADTASTAELFKKEMVLCSGMDYLEELARLCLEDAAGIPARMDMVDLLTTNLGALLGAIQYQKITEYELKRAAIRRLSAEHPEDSDLKLLGGVGYDIY
jgi:hypothetical protein